MTIEKITYEKIFPTGIPYANEKIGATVIINAGENEMDAVDMARKMAQENHRKAYPELYQDKTPDVSIVKKINNVSMYDDEMHNHNKTYTLEEQINTCTSIKTLESYKFIVKGKPELETAYNNRLKELT